MFRDEPYRAAFEAAARTIQARIRRDRARAPNALRKVFTVVARRLFDPTLNATRAWKAARIKDSALMGGFAQFTGTSLRCYLAEARIEVASLLMATTDLDLASISERVGFTYPPTFAENYKRVKGKLPSEEVRKPLPPPLIDDETSLGAARGLLNEEAMARHIEDLLQICPGATKHLELFVDDRREPQIVVDGAHTDQMMAEGLWQRIRDLSFTEQCQQVRRFLFCSPVLFDLLREKSLQEGRKSRRRGVEVAKLALVSLEGSDQVLGDRIHDLRAFGWAWLGNAHRLALDFSAAVAAFEQADNEWSVPRVPTDLLVLANICALRGSLFMMRREYASARRELDRSCSLYRELGEARDEARELATRAMINTYAGNLDEAVEDFREAASLIDEDQEKELAFAIRGNLAATFVRAGSVAEASVELALARQLNRNLEDRLGAIKLDWIEGDLGELHGDLEKAKKLFTAARAGFRDMDELRYYGKVSVDLMAIQSKQGEWEQVGVLASETIPILSSMDLHSETFAAVGLLVEAVKEQGLSHQLLVHLRAALRQDPLTM